MNESKEKRGGTAIPEVKGITVEFAGCLTDSTSVMLPNDLWTYADSGVKIHIFHARNAFVPGSLMSCHKRAVCRVDNGKFTTVKGVVVNIPLDDCVILFCDVLFVSSLGYNILSTGLLADNGIGSYFRRSDILLKLGSNGTLSGRGSRDIENGMYVRHSPRALADTASASLSDHDRKFWPHHTHQD